MKDIVVNGIKVGKKYGMIDLPFKRYGSIKLPSVIFDGTLFHLWFELYPKEYSNSFKKVFHVTSTDGLKFENPTLLRDPVYNITNEKQNIISYKNELYTFLSYYQNDRHEIAVAKSKDGGMWYDITTVLTPDEKNECDNDYIYEPCVILVDKVFHIWFTSSDYKSSRIQYAKINAKKLVKALNIFYY